MSAWPPQATLHLPGGDALAAAVDIGHLDGPWDPPNNFRKTAGELRYASGTATDGISVTGMYYKGQGRFTTDQPQRAIAMKA